MAEDEEYELVPHKVVSELKKEVEELKQNPLGSTAGGHDLQGSMNALAHSINDLLTLFKDATDQMRMEEKDSQVFSKRLDPMLEKLDTIIDQNHKIAKGILAVADMLHEHLKHKPKFSPPMSAPYPNPQMSNPPYQMPMRMPPPPARPTFRSPFPEFSPMQDMNSAMTRPAAPPLEGNFGQMPENMGMGEPSPRPIPPAPAPPKMLNP